MEAAVGPHDAPLRRHLSSLLGVLNGFDKYRPIRRVNSLLPTLVRTVETARQQAMQGFLVGRPIIDFFLDVPIESHRAGGFLCESEQIPIGLQPLDCLFALRDVLVDGDDKSRQACGISQQCENHIRPYRAAVFKDEMFFLAEAVTFPFA